MKHAQLSSKSVATSSSILNYRTNNKIPPIGKIEHEESITFLGSNATPVGPVSPDKQTQMGAMLTGGTRGGSTIVLISTKISNSSTAKLGSATQGAMINTTGTLYNIPSPVCTDNIDNRKLATVCQESTAMNDDENDGHSESQNTSKTATILVSKHKTKTGLPLLLKKSKK